MNKKNKRFSDFTPKLDFHNDLPRAVIGDILGQDIEVKDCFLIPNFKTDYGVHDCLLVHFADCGDGKEYTTITSGQVLIKKITGAKNDGNLPLIGRIILEKNYYDIV